ncbi:hypothetical protein [Streptomyces mesophilus]|uniref:hypothetical protein n=1 Tax=Streptomyces mesophilus TaxID=1775132 RepID=UPI00331CFD91
MHRGLVHAAAWTCATGAAVTLSWWGVHTVMSGTAYDPPRALPLTASHETTQQAVDPKASSTRRPKEPSKSGDSGKDSNSGKPSESSRPDGKGSSSPSSSPSKSGSSSPSSSAAAGDVKPYSVSGGRVVFEIHAASAELVSATPKTGWEMQIWKQPQQDWIRVTFTQGTREVSVFCTWHDHAPQVEIDDP